MSLLAAAAWAIAHDLDEFQVTDSEGLTHTIRVGEKIPAPGSTFAIPVRLPDLPS